MRKNTRFGMVMFLAFSLAFPIYSSAADMTLTLRTEDGFSVTTNTPTIKSFAVDNDNNLTVILKDPPILDFGNPYPQITIGTCSACTISNNANVKATPRTSFSFNVTTTTGATLSSDTLHQGTSIVPDNYGAMFLASGNTGIFSWNTAGTAAGAASIAAAPSGRYLAVFTATPSTCPLLPPNTCTSQLVVVINISQQYKLTLTAGANGTVSPAGDSYYDPGTSVPISATPNPNYSFTGWSDGGTGNPRTVVMSQDRTITANFGQIPTYTLQVNSSDSGVPITVSQADNNSLQSGNAPFTRTYNQNTAVTLTAPSTYNNKNFSGWTGADSVSGTQATVTMTGSKTVTVNYTSTPTYTLQVNSSDPVSITVSQADNNGQQSGNAPFTRTYNQNTVVTLTAPSTYSGKNFSAWTGADSVSGTQATVTMTGSKTVTVNYTSPTPTGTPLAWNTRTPFSVSAGSEQIFIASVDTSDKIYLAFSLIGLTNDTNANYTWTFPDGTVFNGAVRNTSINGILLLRTRTWGSPNIPYDYIPSGKHVIRINAINNSSFVLTAALY